MSTFFSSSEIGASQAVWVFFIFVTLIKHLSRCMPFHVYILHSLEYNKIYIGYTGDLESRLNSHNELANKGWTIKFRPWKLVHTEVFETKSEAMRWKKQLKSARGREFIRKEILKQLIQTIQITTKYE